MGSFENINAEDSMLLAMVIDDLRMQPESRSESWIVGQLEAGSPHQIAGFFARRLPGPAGTVFRALLRRWGTATAERIHSLLPLALEEQLLVASHGHDGEHYATTETGRSWSEEVYAALGRARLDDDDRLSRLADASEICKALSRHASGMTREDVLTAAFPPMDWDTGGRPGLRAQQEAYNACLPAIFERAITTAIEEGWIVEADGRLHLTAPGEDAGTTCFDDWR